MGWHAPQGGRGKGPSVVESGLPVGRTVRQLLSQHQLWFYQILQAGGNKNLNFF